MSSGTGIGTSGRTDIGAAAGIIAQADLFNLHWTFDILRRVSSLCKLPGKLPHSFRPKPPRLHIHELSEWCFNDKKQNADREQAPDRRHFIGVLGQQHR